MNRLLFFFTVILLCTSIAFSVGKTGDQNKSVVNKKVVIEQIPTEPLLKEVYDMSPPTPIGVGKAPLAGNYNIGVGGDFTTLKAAVLALNSEGISDDVTFYFTDNTYTDSVVSIGNFSNPNNKTVTFKPAPGVSPVITFIGNASTSTYGWRLDGCKNVVIDGSNSGTLTRDLTIILDTTATQYKNAIHLRNGTKNIVLKNLNVFGWRKYSTTYMVSPIVLATGTAPADENLLIDNCLLARGYGGIEITGAATVRIKNVEIKRCDFGYGNEPVNHLHVSGIFIRHADGVKIHHNDVQRITTHTGTSATSPHGIRIYENALNVEIYNNKVHNITDTYPTGTTYPIGIADGNSGRSTTVITNTKIYNNMIYDLKNPDGGGHYAMGIQVYAKGNTYIYNNTINLEGIANTGGAGYASRAILIYMTSIPTPPNLPPDTTFLFNNMIGTGVQSVNHVNQAVGNLLSTLVSDNNYFYYHGSNARLGYFMAYPYYPVGYAYTTYNLADWHEVSEYIQGAPLDLNSWEPDDDPNSVDVPFVNSVTDPHVGQQYGDYSPWDNAGIPYGNLGDDIDGEPRDPNTPDIGADEFTSGSPRALDAYPLAILGPNPAGVPDGFPAYPKVKVRNYGNSPSTTIPINVKIYDPASQLVYNENDYAENVGPFEYATKEFSVAWLPNGPGTYTIEARTLLSGDEVPANDGPISRTQLVIGKKIPPYVSLFETPEERDGWSHATTNNTTSNWLLGLPQKTTLNSAYSDTSCWYTGPKTGNYATGWEAAVYSPFFDFSSLSSPVVSFALFYQTEPGWDAAIFEYSIDGGQTWVKADNPRSVNWYNDLEGDPDESLTFDPPWWSGAITGSTWQIAKINLPELAHQSTVRFRMNFGSDAAVVDEGVAFDNFKIYDGSTISGVKFYDKNQNGVKDEGETGLEGWKIHLSGTLTDMVTTGSDGSYIFENLFDGEYEVTEELKPGWVNTYPEGGTYNITLAPGESALGKDFGNYWANASITGMKWEDLNANGVKDEGEPGLDGWTINLAGPINTSTVTAGGGLYAFNNLVEGAYTVSEVLQAGWKSTYPAGGSYNVVINADGQVVADLNFGNFKYAVVSGLVYKDVNHNGVKELTEPGMDAIPVNLAGPMPGSTVTANGGQYNLLADFGANVLSIVLPANKYVTNPVGGKYNINVTTSAMVFANKDFGVSTKMDSLKFRTFLPEDIAAVDAKGKIPKAVKRKPVGGYWEFELTNNTGSDQTELHIQFKNDVAYDRGLTANPFTTIAGDTKKKFDFTGATIPDGGTVIVKGYSKKGKPQQIKKFYWGANPKEHYAVNINPDFEYLELSMPTYANLIDEVYADGGFTADGGLLVGTPHPEAPKEYGWLLIGKPGDVQKTLRDKTGLHTGGPKFFSLFENGKPLVKLQKTLPPSKHNNKLLAELIALKLAIAASATEHIPVGLGELKYYDPGSTFDGMMVKDIYAYISARMTSRTGDSIAYYNVVRQINEAFAGPIDTVSFSSATVLTGVKYLADVPFLRHADGEVLSVITPVERKYVDVPDVFELAQNYPNPFNPTTTIQFILPEDAIVTLKVYNVLGQEVATLVDKELFTEGMNEVEFDAGNLASGIYFYHIVAEGVGENAQKFSQVKKMILMK